MTKRITEEDVASVGASISIEVTEGMVEYVLNNYDSEERKDSTATFDLIIENLIYSYMAENNNNDSLPYFDDNFDDFEIVN